MKNERTLCHLNEEGQIVNTDGVLSFHFIGFMFGGLVTINGMSNPYPAIFQTNETYIFPDSTYKRNRKI